MPPEGPKAGACDRRDRRPIHESLGTYIAYTSARVPFVIAVPAVEAGRQTLDLPFAMRRFVNGTPARRIATANRTRPT
jgi:hypothetical protein